MITFNCSFCGTKINAKRATSGQKGKCPRCHNICEIPFLAEAITEKMRVEKNVSKAQSYHVAGSAKIDNPQKAENTYSISKLTKKCSSCHHENHDLAQFCEKCGKSFSGLDWTDSGTGRSDRTGATRFHGMSMSRDDLPTKILPYLKNGERILFFSRMALSVLIIKLSALGVIFIPALLGYIGAEGYSAGFWIGLSVGLLSAYVFWLIHKNRFYIVTNKKVIISDGILNVGMKMIPVNKIEMVAINTGLIDKLIGTNTIEISNGAMGGSNLFSFIPVLSSLGKINLTNIPRAPLVVQMLDCL